MTSHEENYRFCIVSAHDWRGVNITGGNTPPPRGRSRSVRELRSKSTVEHIQQRPSPSSLALASIWYSGFAAHWFAPPSRESGRRKFELPLQPFGVRGACRTAALGLDPGLGVLHVDTKARIGLACELMEPVLLKSTRTCSIGLCESR